MFKKYLIILLAIIGLYSNAIAGDDGELILKKNNPSEVKDCFEGLNRATFAFNQGLDKIIIKPVATVYRVLPQPVRSGVSNSLDNLSNLVTIPNNILQGDFKTAGTNIGRFIINTTIGILGIFDAAEGMGLPEYEKEDYGQSLAKVGVGPGCYLILPVLGPSTVRDATGSVANFVGGDAWYNVTVRNDTQHFEDAHYYTSKVMAGVDFRAKNYNEVDNLEKNSVDFYSSVKSLYLQDRQQKIMNSKRITNTQNDSDWEEIDTQ